jgi:hypothetical protein
MKHIKTFEDISKTPKFEIGDYVKLKNSRNYIYQITDYHTVLDKYYLEDTLETDGYRRDDIYWVSEDELILVPQHEMDAVKYNL